MFVLMSDEADSHNDDREQTAHEPRDPKQPAGQSQSGAARGQQAESGVNSEGWVDDAGRRGDRPRQPPRGGGGVTDAINTDELVYVVAVFAAVGVGIGLNALFASILTGGVASLVVAGFLGVTGLAVAVFAGPVVAAMTSLRVDDRMDATKKERWLTAAVGTGVGHFVMMILASVLISVAAGSAAGGGDGGDGGSVGGGSMGGSSGGGGGLPIGDLLVPILGIAVATAVVGAGVVFIREWDRNRRRPPARNADAGQNPPR